MLLTDDLLYQLVVGEISDCAHHLVLLGIHQPPVVEGNVEEVKDDALGSVLKVGHARETHVHVQPSLREKKHMKKKPRIFQIYFAMASLEVHEPRKKNLPPNYSGQMPHFGLVLSVLHLEILHRDWGENCSKSIL